MSPDKSAKEANNIQASDSEPVHEEIDLSSSPKKAEAIGSEYERIDWEDEQNRGRSERWHSFETP
jgi:hypothetical protein